MRLVVNWCVLIVSILIIGACGNSTDISSNKAITSFSIVSPAATGVINETSRTIEVTLPPGTDLKALTAVFATTGQSISVEGKQQVSGRSINNFTTPLTYTVTAIDGTIADYIVTIADGSFNHPFQIKSVADLKFVGSGSGGWNLDSYYMQTADIDMAGSGDWTPVGTTTTPFTGSFDGRGYWINNLSIANVDYQGLFGAIGTGARLSNIHLKGVKNTGASYVGRLAGIMMDGTVTGCSADGSNIGYCKRGGGLISTVTAGTISHCYSSGSIGGSIFPMGGLIAINIGGTISNCYSTVAVSGTSNSSNGGLIGSNSGTVTRCYSTGRVDGDTYNGGLVGDNVSGAISDCFSIGSVSGYSAVGGLVGNNGGIISRSYSRGLVSGGSAGGLVGNNSLTVTDSYYDSQTSGQADNTGKGVPKTTAEMQTQSTYAGWDFASVWLLNSSVYPLLRGL